MSASRCSGRKRRERAGKVESTAGLVKAEAREPHPEFFTCRSGMGQIICNSNKFSDYVDAAGTGTTLGTNCL